MKLQKNIAAFTFASLNVDAFVDLHKYKRAYTRVAFSSRFLDFFSGFSMEL